jgi:hypothetical protein
VHGTGVYSAGVGPKDPALERIFDIKKKSLMIMAPFAVKARTLCVTLICP